MNKCSIVTSIRKVSPYAQAYAREVYDVGVIFCFMSSVPNYNEEKKDIQSALNLLIEYCSNGSSHRALSHRTLKRARRLLDLWAMWQADGITVNWELKENWRSRLLLAGLNPDNPEEVLDEKAWDLAFRQLIDRNVFREDVHHLSMANGCYKAIGPKPKSKPPREYLEDPSRVEERGTINDYLTPDLKARLRGRNRQ